MRLRDGHATLSASDLSNHLGCHHLTQLDLSAARGERRPPVWRDPVLEVLQQRGFEHEAAFLDHLRAQGKTVLEVSTPEGYSAVDATRAALASGADVIAQATLAGGEWFGRADVLLRVPDTRHPSGFSYEVLDTKLARETRAGTILQLCLYSELLAELQGVLPEHMHVVSPGTDFTAETFRVDDHLAYHRYVKTRLQRVLADEPATYPEPCAQCDICRWWRDCTDRRRADDHLSLVAGISRMQRRELLDWQVTTLTALAQAPLPLPRPTRGTADSLLRVREQARVQLQARLQDRPVHELLPREPDRGLLRLPEPSPGDVFFDIEGDAFVGTAGLEYLLGWVTHDTGTYHALWAEDATAERQSFEAFIDAITARRQQYPTLHIYHFAPYEPGALKRLMGRYNTREHEVDALLRGEVFVDLYAVVRQAVRAGIERYSIKDLEVFYGYQRAVDLRDASKHLRAYERALELGLEGDLPDEVRHVVQVYNADDCYSTLHLRDWLEALRADLVRQGEHLPRPEPKDGAPTEALSEAQQRVQDLVDRLTAGLSDDPAERTEPQQAAWLLAQLLGFHRREDKTVWWEFFRVADLDLEDLREERAALADLELVEAVGGTAKCPIHRYRFPPQETSVAKGDDVFLSAKTQLGTVEAIDFTDATVDIKKRAATAHDHPEALFSLNYVRTGALSDALLRLGEWVAEHGIDAPGPHRAERDLLLREAPRTRTHGALQGSGESTMHAALRLAKDLEGGVLPIQGPPGTGKTYTGARMICALVAAGKRVGITATSHKVIRNLLDGVIEAAKEQGLQVGCVQKISSNATPREGEVREVTESAKVLAALQDGTAQLAAGTAWLWSGPDFAQSVDVLFVDEAGQMSLANVLAAAQAARSVVLLGDPQQLDQPLKGSHPEGADASALEHLLGDHPTIPADRGLFLGETWRLHPDICAFTSEVFYESRLTPRSALAHQRVTGPTRFAGTGLRVEAVAHDGNRNSAPEEVDAVAAIVADLLQPGTGWIDADGAPHPLGLDEILIVAPYNAQVTALSERLAGARVGTVDKFQGQEAPVVIYSMATSSPEEAPRGMEFLFSLNRLNVATSRARCVCVLVANPALFELECRTPRQIRLANAFCRYVELASAPANHQPR